MIIDRKLIGREEFTYKEFKAEWFEKAKTDGFLIFDGLKFDEGAIFDREVSDIKSIEFHNCIFVRSKIEGLKNFDEIFFHNSNQIVSLTINEFQGKKLTFEKSKEDKSDSYQINRLNIKNSTIDQVQLRMTCRDLEIETVATKFLLIDYVENLVCDVLKSINGKSEMLVTKSNTITLLSVIDYNVQIAGYKGISLIISLSQLTKLQLTKAEFETVSIVDTTVIHSLDWKEIKIENLKLWKSSLNSKRNYLSEFEIKNASMDIETSLPLDLNNEDETEKIKGFSRLKMIAKSNGKFSLVDHYEKERLIANYRIRKVEVKQMGFSEQFDFLFTHTLPYHTSRFNYEFWRPVFVFLILVHPFWTGVLIFSLNRDIPLAEWPISFINDYIGLYFHTVFPFHDIQYSESIKVPLPISFFMRIYSSYFIYQIVTASRKLINRAEEL